MLPAHIAIIDQSRTIIAVNKAWRDFATQNGAMEQLVTEGANYLRVCDSASGDQPEQAATFAGATRAVIFGRKGEFAMAYPYHSPAEWRWFEARVANFPADGPGRAMITHVNITERKRLEDQLKRQTRRLAEAPGTDTETRGSTNED